MFLNFSRKYKNFRKGLILERLQTKGMEIIDLVDKQTKISYIYYIFYYYLRFLYRTLAVRFTLSKSKISRLRIRLFRFLKNIHFERKKRIKYIKKPKIRLAVIKKLKPFSYDFFNKLVNSFSNLNINLSVYLEQFGLYTNLRNIRKLLGSFRLSLIRISKMRTYKLKKIIKNIRKYLWHYKKLILARIHLRKFNFFVQCVLLFISSKLSLTLYLSNYWFINANINYISWLPSILFTYLCNMFICLPFKQTNKIIIHSCRIMRTLFKASKILPENFKNYKKPLDFIIDYKSVGFDFNRRTKGNKRRIFSIHRMQLR
jgi:hypothetical protein